MENENNCRPWVAGTAGLARLDDERLKAGGLVAEGPVLQWTGGNTHRLCIYDMLHGPITHCGYCRHL